MMSQPSSDSQKLLRALAAIIPPFLPNPRLASTVRICCQQIQYAAMRQGAIYLPSASTSRSLMQMPFSPLLKPQAKTFGMNADSAEERSHSHHFLGQVLAVSSWLLFLGRSQPHAARILAVAVFWNDRTRLDPPGKVLVPLQTGLQRLN